MESFIEFLNHLVPLAAALGNLIELLLHIGGEVIIDDGLEIAYQELVDEHTYVSRDELGLLIADVLFASLFGDFVFLQGVNLVGTCLACYVFLLDVISLLDG